MGKTRAECSQNAYTSHASAFLSHWWLNTNFSKFFAQIWHKKKKKKTTLFFRILRSVGRGQHKKKNLALWSYMYQQWPFPTTFIGHQWLWATGGLQWATAVVCCALLIVDRILLTGRKKNPVRNILYVTELCIHSEWSYWLLSPIRSDLLTFKQEISWNSFVCFDKDI